MQESKNGAVSWDFVILEREGAPSLLICRRSGPSVLDGVRSKVDLCGEGYAWIPIWWSSDNSKRYVYVPTCVIL